MPIGLKANAFVHSVSGLDAGVPLEQAPLCFSVNANHSEISIGPHKSHIS
jgi:hypothetical protein